MSIARILKRVAIVFVHLVIWVVVGFYLLIEPSHPVQFLLLLTFGWIPFMRDSFAIMEVNPLLFAEMVACIAVLGVSTHGFMRWLGRDMTPEATSVWHPSWTVTGLVSVFLLFISCMAVIGVIHQSVWLLISQEPWYYFPILDKRDKVSEGLVLGEAAKRAVSKYLVNKGRFPNSNAETGLEFSTSNSSKYVRGVDVGQGGVVTVTFTATVAPHFSGKTLIFTPTMVSKQVPNRFPMVLVDWSCHKGTLERKWCPDNFRYSINEDRVIRVTNAASFRLSSISFFLALLLLCVWGFKSLWNYVRRDFPRFPYLNYPKALALVLLLGMLFNVVLLMVTGTRELMTLGVREKSGAGYKLKIEAPNGLTR